MAGAAALAGMMGGAGAERARVNEAATQNAADDARLAKQLAQQQGQYDTTLANEQKEFGADLGLRSTAAGDVHKQAEYTLSNLLPAQLAATQADTKNTTARTAGQLGANALADATAGLQKQLLSAQVLQAKTNNANSAGDTVAHRDQMAREAQQAARDLEAQRDANELARVRLEASLRVVKNNDPEAFLKQAMAANTAAANEAQKIFGPTKPGEQPMLSDPERKLVLKAAGAISSSANPLQAAYAAINTGTSVKPADPNNPEQVANAQLANAATAKAASYLLQLGVAAQMTRMTAGGNAPPGTLATAIPTTPAAGSLASAVPPSPPKAGTLAHAVPTATPKPTAPIGLVDSHTPPMQSLTQNDVREFLLPGSGKPAPAPTPVPVPPNANQALAKARSLPPQQRALFISQQPPAVQAVLRQYFPGH